MKCPKCGSRDIDFLESGGQSICVSCGTVLEENTIVSSIEFQETGDRSHVVGQFLSANCARPYQAGSRSRDSRDSREATLANARRAISHIASGLHLPSLYVDKANRLYQIALQRNFIFGRKQAHVAATCLYIICRQEQSPLLLIDFSDALQINVYILGKSFLQFTKVLNIPLPVIDPSLYIHRYAARLELGDCLDSVCMTCLRIVTRMRKDWIHTGRRPDGICAAAMFIATRSHNFIIKQGDMAKLFRISNETLMRRLRDFKSTPAAQLTLQQFHLHYDVDISFDPPSYIQNKINESHTDENKQFVITLNLPENKISDDDNNHISEEKHSSYLSNEELQRVIDNPSLLPEYSDSSDEDLNEDDGKAVSEFVNADLENDEVYQIQTRTRKTSMLPSISGQQASLVKRNNEVLSENDSDSEEEELKIFEIKHEIKPAMIRKEPTEVKLSMFGPIPVNVPIPGAIKSDRLLSKKKQVKLVERSALYDELYSELIQDSEENDALTQESKETADIVVHSSMIKKFTRLKEKKLSFEVKSRKNY
eukprot:gene11694-15657_t